MTLSGFCLYRLVIEIDIDAWWWCSADMTVTPSSPAMSGATCSVLQVSSTDEHRLSSPNRWPIGGGEQDDRHVSALHHRLSSSCVVGLAALGGVLLQHLLPICIVHNAIPGWSTVARPQALLQISTPPAPRAPTLLTTWCRTGTCSWRRCTPAFSRLRSTPSATIAGTTRS
jgi:hypothetical protein